MVLDGDGKWEGKEDGEKTGKLPEGNGEKAGKKQEKTGQNARTGNVYTDRIDSKTEVKTASKVGVSAPRMIFENLTWLTSNEAAEYLRLPSVGALRVLVCKRRVPFHKLGRSLRFKRAELDRLLDASKHTGGF